MSAELREKSKVEERLDDIYSEMVSEQYYKRFSKNSCRYS